MNITEPGKITERIFLLGRLETCVQVIDGGSEAALIGGSMAYAAPEVIEQVERFGLDERKITRLVILHAHFDHCGLIPFLKRRWPWARVTASARARELLASPKVSGAIAAMNAGAAARFGRAKQVAELGAAFDGIEVEDVLDDGDTLTCGEVELGAIAVPGHSSCSIALYEPCEKALFGSDAVGIAFGDFFLSAGNSDFDLYQQSLGKMAALEVEVLLKEHYGAHVGDEARGYLGRSVAEAVKTRSLLVDAWRRTRDPKQATAEVVEAIAGAAPGDFLPREVLAMVVGQMVR